MRHDPKFLEPVEQEALAGIAARALRGSVPRRTPPDEAELEKACREFPRLAEHRGAFVTIYVGGELRGCLGEIAAQGTLARVVARCASQVTCADYRFDPLRPEDLANLSFKLSVLTPPQPINPADQLETIEIGRHGLILRYADKIGVLLPEVAAERHWDRATFIEQIRRKAGVDPQIPLSRMSLETFESQVIEGKGIAA